MWHRLSSFILRYRLVLLGVLLTGSLLFGYLGVRRIKIENNYGILLPKDAPAKQSYERLKRSFGGSESTLIFSIQCADLYTVENFNAWYDLGERLKAFDAVDAVISEAHLLTLKKDAEQKKFAVEKIVAQRPSSQREVDSLQQLIRRHPLYEGLLFNSETSVSLMMVLISEDVMQDMKTANVLFDIESVARSYAPLLGEVRISGMPHIRVTVGDKLKGEFGLFIALSIAMTSLLLYLFFRSFKTVLICNTVVFTAVIFSLGSIGAFDFKLSILMVLIPPLIIVISIPNCIFLINKFHREVAEHGNKVKALARAIQKIGNATFLTNLTTALGFSTFIFTNSERLSEFGIIASVNILMVFVLSITILPIVLSYLDLPKSKHLKHLEKQWLHVIVKQLEYLSLYRRRWVYIVTVVLVIVAALGTSLMKTTGNITGDLPQDDPITTDLKFIEQHFGGAIPFDILIDTKSPNSFHRRFEEIEAVQQYLANFDFFSKSISVTDGIKLLNMAFSPTYRVDKFSIPSVAKLNRIADYLEHTPLRFQNLLLLDSSRTLCRISLQMKDTGSYDIQSIMDTLYPKVHTLINPDHYFLTEQLSALRGQKGSERAKTMGAIYRKVPEIKNRLEAMFNTLTDEDLVKEEQRTGFVDSLEKAVAHHEWDVTITGTAVVASKGMQYLLSNLLISLGCAIVLIGLLMALLFRSWRMAVVSLIPNFIPLLFTAGIMGFAGIPVKPSTLLVFSVAFGISVDDTIHFLAKFRQEVSVYQHDLRRCILVALRETGVSMIYTSVVLFFGFLVLAGSQFGGTKALGLLISLTLLIAMFTNLMILPSLLLRMEKKIADRALAEPLLQLYDEEEDIEMDRLEIDRTLDAYRKGTDDKGLSESAEDEQPSV